jgi:adenosylcobalamin-dependent ribonucleoside-diphosphate reductase
VASELFEDELGGGSTTDSAPLTNSTKRGKNAAAAAVAEAPNTTESSSEPGGAVPLMASPTSDVKQGEPLLPERIADAPTGQGSIFAGEGLSFERYFTEPGTDVFDTTEWDYRTAIISGEGGAVVFEQKDVEIPKAWSMLATNVVVSKYFRGKVGTPGRENSVKQLVSRVADTIWSWGKQGNYFATEEDADVFHAELKYLLLHQYMAFNSPVWFNLGVPGERPQVSACQPYGALVSTPQGLIPIGKLVEDNAVGTTVYDAKGTTRVVATKANGVKNVLRVHTKAGYTLDVTADHLVWKKTSGGSKKSGYPGGKFVEAGSLKAGDQLMWHRTPLTGKADQEGTAEAEAALAGWLQSDGFVGQYETGTNRSLTIEALVVNADEEAWVRDAIAQVFPDVHTNTRDFITQDETLQGKRIRLYGESLRPFVEKWGLLVRGTEMTVPERLYTAPYSVVAAYLRSVFQAEGYVILRDNAALAMDMISGDLIRGVQKLLLRFGIYSRVRYKADARADRKGCYTVRVQTLGDRKRWAQEIGFIGSAKQEKLIAGLDRKGLELATFKRMEIQRIEDLGAMEVYDIQTESGEYLSGNLRVHNCFINSVEDTMESILTLAKTEGMLFKWGSGTGTNVSVLRSSQESLKGGGTASGPVSFMRGFDAFAGAIKSGGKTRRAAKMVILNADHPDIEEFIECKADSEKKAHALIEAGYSGAFNVPNGAYDSVFFQNANHSVRGTDDFMRAVELDRDWSTREVLSGNVSKTYRARDIMRKIAEATWVCGDPGMQFDTTANRWHTCPNTGRINASNPCSEFFFLDDTACNLASLNLMKFRTANREFDVEMFRHAVRVTSTAMEIMVGNAAYPTDKITINSHDYRPLGLGYANLGALLMARGLAYDSDEGRAYAAAITAILSGEGYTQSAKIARRVGPFAGYEKNKQPMTRVMQMHRDHVEAIAKQYVPDDMIQAARKTWDACLDEGAKYGYRNSQISVLAPTGTIGFMMDCDTTGVEPDIAIVKFKSLVGGGFFKIVNQTVPEALERLGYSASERKAILEYIEEKDTIEGAPGLSDDHLPIFDCAFRAKNGVRSIHYMGHIKMMSAVQPFISGAISKTVNMPHDAVPDDIAEAYLEAWKLGVKALAIYRDGSKKTQPLSTGKTETPAKPEAEVAKVEFKPFRRKLPDERAALTHKFSVGGHEGYITIGTYPDGQVGEIFVTMSKEGSVVSG